MKSSRELMNRIGMVTLVALLFACTTAERATAQLGLDNQQTFVAASGESMAGLWRMAADGKLDDLWQRIRQMPDDDARAALLKRDLTLHQTHEAERQTETRQAYDKAVAAMQKHIDANELAKALGRAVESHGLSPDPDSFLKDARVTDLVERAHAAAKLAETREAWFEALLLYRRLDYLFDQKDRYRDELKRVSRKLRLLRLYAHEAYFELADQFAITQGEQPSARWESDDESWEKELEGIDQGMLLQAMTRAADRHVESSSYETLFIGGLESLRVMLATPGLDRTFTSLGDEEKVKQFDGYLAALIQTLQRQGNWMTYSQTATRVKNLLEKNRESINLPESVIIHEFADGAMSTLDDFTGIIWPTEMERFKRTTEQQFSGVGIQITLSDDELTVVSPLEGTPAHRAGLKAGDRIVTIDGKTTTGIALEQAVRAITGEEGTQVRLGIKRMDSDAVREVSLTRRRIHIDSVRGFQRKPGGQWDYMIDPIHRIGYLRITQFGPDTAIEMDKAVQEMQLAGELNGLVLDMRFNPGGLLKAAVDVSNRFIDQGVIVSSGDATGGADGWAARADVKDTYRHFPVVVLINKGSASASEIVAGALQDHRRALIVGENSYGKGSVQQLFPLQLNRALVKVTTQYYKLPSGRIIHRRPGADAWGVKPDVEVMMTDFQVEKLIRARMVVDVLRETDDQVDPQSLLGQQTADDDNAIPLEDLPKTARELLDRGYDPQLESATLLLKARLVGDLAAK